MRCLYDQVCCLIYGRPLSILRRSFILPAGMPACRARAGSLPTMDRLPQPGFVTALSQPSQESCHFESLLFNARMSAWQSCMTYFLQLTFLNL